MIYYLFLLLIAIIPVAIILYFVYKGDKKKEPKGLLFKLFMSGVLSCFIVLSISIVLYILFPSLNEEELSILEVAIDSYIGVALVEEFSKWIMAFFFGYKSKFYEESYDILIYSVFVSLGFACLENILYVLSNGILTGILRAILSVPSHAFDAVFMGYYLSLAKKNVINKNIKCERKYIILSILVPVFLHGTYDFLLEAEYVILLLLFFIFVIYLYVIAIKRIKNMSKNNKTIIFKNKFCPECGTIVVGEYCSNCGKYQE